jgi:UDP-glucose 4-epimerase
MAPPCSRRPLNSHTTPPHNARPTPRPTPAQHHAMQVAVGKREALSVFGSDYSTKVSN